MSKAIIREIDWGLGRRLVGNGPGYLLIYPNLPLVNRVLELSSGLARELSSNVRHKLKGLVKGNDVHSVTYHLSRIYGGETFSGFPDSKNVVLEAISAILKSPPPERDKLIRKLGTCLRAAWHLQHSRESDSDGSYMEELYCKHWFVKEGTPISVIDLDYGDRGGTGSLISFRFKQYLQLTESRPKPDSLDLRRQLDPVSFTVLTAQDSIFAQLGQELRRIPTKKDLREKLMTDPQSVTKLCTMLGFSWLPEAQKRRPKKPANRLW